MEILIPNCQFHHTKYSQHCTKSYYNQIFSRRENSLICRERANLPRRPWFNSWVRKLSWRRDSLHTPTFLGFPHGSDGKEPTCDMGDLDSISALGRFPGGGHGHPLQYSCLENPHGQMSLARLQPWGGKELDMAEQLRTAYIA